MRTLSEYQSIVERLRQINEEIAHYPQPIARCDAQLGGLLEERSRLQAELEELKAHGSQVTPNVTE